MKNRMLKYTLSFILILAMGLFIGCNNNNPPPDEPEKCTVTLNKTELSLILGDSYEFTVQTTGESETLLTWASDNEDVITVDDGKIQSHKIGSAKVTATYGEATASCDVTVSLGSVVPELAITTNEEEIVLVPGQQFNLATALTFNGKNYSDYQLECNGDKTVADYSLNGTNVDITANSVGEQTLTIKALWNNLDSETNPTLVKVVKIKVINDFSFNLNNGESVLEDVVKLYTVESLAGEEYSNSIPYVVSAVFNGNPIESSDITVNVLDQEVVNYSNGTLTAVKAGSTKITLSYTQGQEVFEKTIDLEVIRPVATYAKTFEAFSIMDGTYTDIENGNTKKSIIKEIFDDDTITDAVSLDGEELTVEDGKILGVKGSNNCAVEKTFTIGTENYAYTIKAIVYGKYLTTAADITQLFGAENANKHLDGYYVLGCNIDASSANVSGGLRFSTTATDSTYGRAAQFVGLFDGIGYTIYNLNVSGTYKKPGSLFGQMCPGIAISTPIVQNVAFLNVKANFASIISTTANYAAVMPIIRNVYVKVSEDTTDFMGLARSTAGSIDHCIVDYPVQDATTHSGGNTHEYGSFVPTANGTLRAGSHNYVISKTPVAYVSATDATEKTSTFVTRYENLTAMKEANNDYSSFGTYWTIVDGLPVWANLPIIAISDVKNRALSIADGSLDLSGLDFTMADVASIKIGDTVLTITDGKLPNMSMMVRKNDKNVNHLELTIDGIADVITINRLSENNDFDALPMTVTLKDNNEYLLSGVRVYNKVLKNADDITWLFGAENANKHLNGYYVLGNNIDASTANVSGGLRFSTTASDSTYGGKAQFAGMFDGMGYTISNLNLSGTYSKPGSLFGQMVPSVSTSVPTVQNVAFVDVKATFASVISTTANFSAVMPVIKNVYVKVSADTTDFMGIARSTAGSIDHCIIEYPVQDATTHSSGATHEYGSFVPTANGTLRAGSHNYVISKTPVAYAGASDATEKTSTFVTRYEDLTAMKAANNDYSSFGTYWTIVDGLPVWANLPK